MRAPLPLLFATFLTFFASATAHAQSVEAEPAPDREAEARALFEDGIVESEAGRWENALTRFQDAHAITERAWLLFNIGEAQLRLGRLRAAKASLLRFRSECDENDCNRFGREADAALDTIESRFGHAMIVVSNRGARDVVLVDGEVVDAADVELDGGAHQIEVRRGDEILLSHPITIAEEERKSVQLVVPSDGTTFVTTSPYGEVAPVADEPPPVMMIENEGFAIWKTGIIASSAVIATGALVAILSLGPRAELREAGMAPFSSVAGVHRQAQRRLNWGWGLLGLGALGLGLSFGLMLGQRDDDNAVEVSLGAGRVSVRGAF